MRYASGKIPEIGKFPDSAQYQLPYFLLPIVVCVKFRSPARVARGRSGGRIAVPRVFTMCVTLCMTR